MNRSASRRNTEELWEKRVHELCTTTTITTNYYSRRCLPRKAAWTIVSHRQEHQVSTASPPGSLPYHIFPEAKQAKQNKQKTKISTNGLSCEDFLNIIISEELQRPITLSLCHFYDYCPPRPPILFGLHIHYPMEFGCLQRNSGVRVCVWLECFHCWLNSFDQTLRLFLFVLRR